MRQRRGGLLQAAAPLLLGAAAGAGVWLAFLRRFERYAVTGASMEPALVDGDWLIVDTAAYRRRAPRPGEIVMAKDPRLPERTLVKRVERQMPAGWWLLGDNADASSDSRIFGAVPDELLLGRLVCRYWPLSRAGRAR